MEIGITVPNVHETLAEPATIAAVARMADDLGFGSVWCNDHVALPGSSPDAGAEPAYAAAYGTPRGQHIYEPLVTLAYLAGITNRVRLGTSVYLLALRHPMLAAREAVSLDRLSGGRLVLGVGVGWLEAEFAAVGVPYRERGRRTDHAITVLKDLCDDASVEFAPKPVQRPHPPLWIGGRSDAAMRRAARAGQAWHPSHLTAGELRERIPELRTECERAGRAPEAVAVATRRRLVRGAAPDGDEAARLLAGDAEAIVATLAELEDVGVGHLIVEVPGGGRAELLENLDWLGREVLAQVAHA